MAQRGVVGIGIGRDKDGRDCICIYVDKETPKILAGLPKSIEEIPVQIVVAGTFKVR